MVGTHSLLKSLSSVIFTVEQVLTSDIILAFNLRRVELDVVAATTGLMDSTASDSLFKNLFVDLELKHTVNVHLLLGHHSVELTSLDLSSGETVEKDSTLTLRVGHVLLNEANDDLVGDKTTSIHNSLGLLSDFSALGNSGTEHISSSEMANAKLVLDGGALSSLAGAGGSNHDNVKGGLLGALVSALNFGEEVVVAHVAKVHLCCV